MTRSIFGRIAFALMVSATTLRCGGSGNPNSPKTLAELQIGGGDFMFVGASQTFMATAVFSDTTTSSVQPVWSSSSSDVIAIDSSTGLATAKRTGGAIITATYQGKATQKMISSAPDYRGRWISRYVFTTCARDAGFPLVTFCSSAAAAPPQPFQIDLTQDRATVSGNLSFTNGGGEVQGSVDPDGKLNLQGSFPVNANGVAFSVMLASWQSELAGDQMTGQFSMQWSIANSPSSAYTQAQFANAERSSPDGVPMIRIRRAKSGSF